jgi:two-component system response regulator PilR (NtrC family)
VKILRVLEDRKISPVGSTEQHSIDVRIIAATNKDVEEEVRRRSFREDLYYRLNVIPITLPPLRDRKDDIPLLAGYFLAKYSRQMGKEITRVGDKALRALRDYDWPGNVRELENIIQREVALAEGEAIESLSFGAAGRNLGRPEAAFAECGGAVVIPEDGLDLEEELERIERDHLREALSRTGGNLMNAAKLLGMSYRSIRYRVKKLKVREQV